MEENTKANKGASVAKTGSISGRQSSSLKTKTQWEQPATDVHIESSPAQVCQDNSPDKSHSSGSPAPRAKKAADKQDIGEQIGRQLRSVYNDVLAQPVPDRFLDLLRELEKDPK